jgi:tRNA wybutosine-synthesizing protein 2
MQNESSATAIIVERSQVKTVKTLLEQHGQYDKSRKIVRHGGASSPTNMVVPTLIPYDELSTEQDKLREFYFGEDVKIIDIIPLKRDVTSTSGGKQRDPLQQAVSKWVETVPASARISHQINELLNDLPTHYMIYPPMLLLPLATFSSAAWQNLLSQLSVDEYKGLCSSIATHFSVTHIARNAPIPLNLESDHFREVTGSNVLRSPLNITPLYGEFGLPEPVPNPSKTDFEAAFWVSVKQNGIEQVWAPLHTMFSRGNVVEKARVLRLASNSDQNFSAVDLYSGIGYFAFSYAKAGASVILGWDINPWSVEGMRRGAERNGWPVDVIKDLNTYHLPTQQTSIRIFEMDNKMASGVVERLRDLIPPVTHVNCGLLPSSRGSWESAVQIVDPIKGGWIHLHENLRNNEISERAAEVEQVVQQMVDQIPCPPGFARKAKLEHIEKVKSYAPGVIHCVLDIYICPILS